MEYFLKLWTLSLFATIVLSQCPPLQPPEGMVMQCMDSLNATLDCSSSNITKGVVAQYRCKNASELDWANSTMKCCRRRWKGIDDFNQFANASCGSQPMTLPASNSTGPEENESSTQPTDAEGNLNDTSTILMSNNDTQKTPGDNSTSTPGSNSSITNSTDSATEPTIEKLRALDLTNANSNSSDSGNATKLQSDTASNSSSPLANDDSNSTETTSTTTASSLSDGSSTSPNVSSAFTPTPDNSTLPSNSSDSLSSTTASSLYSPSAGTSLVPSDNSSSATPVDPSVGINSSDTTASINSVTGSPLPSDNSSSTTVGPSIAGETSGQVPPTNSTLIVDDIDSRQSKDVKLSTNGPGNATTDSQFNNTLQNPESSSLVPTVGASLTITNSSTVPNDTASSSSGDSPTTPLSTNISNNSSSTAGDSTIIAPENVMDRNETSSGEDVNSTDFRTLALNLHNKLRSNHNSQPLLLNETLSNIAQQWAENLMNQSKLIATPGKRPYAENLFKISGGDKVSDMDAIESAMKAWSSSASWFNYSNPKPTGFSQIVWNATTQLGIGLATGNDSSIVVATYYPRGNVMSVGSKADPTYYFKKNVFPASNNTVEVVPASGNTTSSTGGINSTAT